MHMRASQVALVTKNPPANARDTGHPGSIPGSKRSPGVGNGHPLQYSCLENPINREAQWAMVHRVTESQTQLSEWVHMRVWSPYKCVSELFTLIFLIISKVPITHLKKKARPLWDLSYSNFFNLPFWFWVTWLWVPSLFSGQNKNLSYILK